MKINKISSYNFCSLFGDKTSFGSLMGLKNISIVKIDTKCGIIGLGEAYVGIYIPDILSSVVKEIESFLLGKNPEDIIKSNFHIPFVSRNGIFKSIYSAIDIALWDIVAKKRRKPLYKILSNYENDYKIYSSGGMVHSNLKELDNNIRMAKKLDHSGFKMRVGRQNWKDDIKRVNFALKLTKKLNLKLMVDAIMGTISPPWNIKTDFFKIKNISKKVYWLEEPFHPDNFEDYQSLVKKNLLTIATGEALSGQLDYKTYLYNKLCNIIQLDVTSCGGISEAIQILKLAKIKKVKISMHVWGSEIASTANAHFAFAFPEVKWLEYPLVQPKMNKSLNNKYDNSIPYKFQKNVKSVGLGVNCNIRKLQSIYKYINGSKYKI
jgi:L-alanine-DL-glutamate epimerase-like enolase superfamily enzyme